MNAQQSITSEIKKRFSCRTYKKEAIPETSRDSLKAYISENRTGPFGADVRFRLITATGKHQNALKEVGTYGVIKNPAGFIIGAVKEAAGDLEDFGYVMEKNILFATRVGLGTCWLGGTFTKSAFAERMDLQSGESIPAVTATGLMASRKSLLEKTMRWGAGADNRKSWHTLFFETTFDRPLLPDTAGDWATVLEMVRIGPSASNRQPWRIVRTPGRQQFHFYMQRSRGYKTRNRLLFGMADLQRVDLGIAMCHFEMTAHEMGFPGKWSVNEPDIGRLPEQTRYVISWDASGQ